MCGISSNDTVSRVGEPFGTLVLALAVTVIEVSLIPTLMSIATLVGGRGDCPLGLAARVDHGSEGGVPWRHANEPESFSRIGIGQHRILAIVP